ncbi:glycosyltransferase [Liquorilactobacillus sp.]
MATYNGEKYIEEQINSILKQTKQIDELVICDDKSSDSTVQIIDSFNCDLIKLKINLENIGYVRNFEQAISMSSGDIIFLADQDDIWRIDKVSKMVTFMNSEKCDLLCSNFDLINQKDEIIEDKKKYNIPSFVIKEHREIITSISFSRLLLGNVVQGCTYCFTKNVRNKYLAINNQEVYHDWQLMLIAAYNEGVFFYNDNLIQYRLHSNNSIGFDNKKAKIELEIKKPKIVPTMVQFFRDFNKIQKLDLITKIRINIVFYLRIAYFIAKLHLPI